MPNGYPGAWTGGSGDGRPWPWDATPELQLHHGTRRGRGAELICEHLHHVRAGTEDVSLDAHGPTRVGLIAKAALLGLLGHLRNA